MEVFFKFIGQLRMLLFSAISFYLTDPVTAILPIKGIHRDIGRISAKNVLNPSCFQLSMVLPQGNDVVNSELEPSIIDFWLFFKQFIVVKIIFCIWMGLNEPLLMHTRFGTAFNFSYNLLVYLSFLQWKNLFELSTFEVCKL